MDQGFEIVPTLFPSFGIGARRAGDVAEFRLPDRQRAAVAAGQVVRGRAPTDARVEALSDISGMGAIFCPTLALVDEPIASFSAQRGRWPEAGWGVGRFNRSRVACANLLRPLPQAKTGFPHPIRRFAPPSPLRGEGMRARRWQGVHVFQTARCSVSDRTVAKSRKCCNPDWDDAILLFDINVLNVSQGPTPSAGTPCTPPGLSRSDRRRSGRGNRGWRGRRRRGRCGSPTACRAG